MKMSKMINGEGIRESVRIASLILFLISLLTFPVAVSKYAATGTGTAGARIAKFDPVWEYEPSGSSMTNNGAGFVNPTGTKTIKWKITNKGETMVKCDLKPKITDACSLVRDVDCSNTAIHQTGLYSATGGRVDFATITDAATGAAVTKNPTTDNITPNGTAAQQTFTFTFTGKGAPAVPAAYNMDSAGNVTNPTASWSYANNSSTGWRAYRVNFDGITTQVD